MSADDVLYRYRLRALALAEELGNVRAACRALGIHHSTFYRWRKVAQRHGLELLRPRERRAPQMPNQTSPMVEQRVLAYSLAHPGQGPARIAAELARPQVGRHQDQRQRGLGVLRRHGLSTRARRLALVAGYAARPSQPGLPQPVRHIQVSRPGELVQMDCFFIGRLSGTTGAVWQFTAIDAYSSFLWAELHASARNPAARFTSALAHRVAADLAERGWALEAVSSDNGSEFTSRQFGAALERLEAEHRRIPRGPPPVKRLCRAGPADGAG